MEQQNTVVRTRLSAQQRLWVLAAADGTLVCARHAQAGLVVLSWTTQEEMESALGRLFPAAPTVLSRHRPEQRTFASLLETAGDLGMRLRIDEYVVDALAPATTQ